MPRILGPLPADRSERRVYRELEGQLPADWVVLSNVSWSTRASGPSGRTWVRDGQADFVVVAPGFGLCVVEVKGSKYVRVGMDGRWYRSHNGKSWTQISPKTPPEQATSNAHELTRIACGRLGWKEFPWPFGYIVVYPQGQVTEGGFSTFDASTIVLRHQLGDLTGAIRGALRARGSMEHRRPLDGDTACEIGEQLMNHPLQIAPADSSDDAAQDRDAIDVLTRQQHAALRGVFLHPSVAVTGPAGSGKTVLAMWRLRALIEQGDDALFLCFNKMLAKHLRMQNPDLEQRIWHADSYFARLVGPQPPASKNDLDRYFNEELPGLVLDFTATHGEHEYAVDALIVDEGQDFGEFRLWAARSLVRDGGTFLYCSDDRQDLYDRGVREAVGAEVVFSLVHNCRNTVRINDTGNRVLDDHIQPMPGLPVGVDTIVEHISGDSRAMAKAAWRHAAAWAGAGVRVAILSPFTLEKSSMMSASKGHNMRLVTELGEWTDTTVLFSTVKSFKGLEADAVVLVDVPELGRRFNRPDLYVATTRARARLAVLCANRDVASLLGTAQ